MHYSVVLLKLFSIIIFTELCFFPSWSTSSIDPRVKLEIDIINLSFYHESKQSHLEALLIEMLARERISNKQWMKEYFTLQYEKDKFKEVIILAACLKNLKYRLDTFAGIDYDARQEDIIGRFTPEMEAIMNSIEDLVVARTYFFHRFLSSFRRLCYQHSETIEFSASNESLWDSDVKSQIRQMKTEHFYGRTSNNGDKKYSISDLINELYFSTDEDTALNLFKNQCYEGRWSYRTPKLEVENLNLFSQKEKHNFLKNYPLLEVIKDEQKRDERNFLVDQLDTGNGKYFLTTDQHYKQCVLVFYFAGNRDPLCEVYYKMKSRWGMQPYSNMVDRFCSSYHALYDLVSATAVMHEHGTVSSIYCTSNSTYYDYIKDSLASPQVRKDFRFVVSILGLIHE